MIVDMHTHIFPSEIASMAVDKLKRASSTHPFSDGTSAGLVRSRQEAGIDCCLILPVATSPKQVSHMNDRAILTNDLYSETGLLSFGGMHPDYPDWKLELSRLARTGVKGIKFHPVYQNVDLDDLRYLRIMDRAAELGLITLTHAGLDVGFPGAVFCTPEMIVNIYRELGGIPLILAHMGGWREWDRVEALLPETGVYLDTAFALGRISPLGDGYYGPSDLPLMEVEQFVRMVREFPGRVLFGTDTPWRDQREGIELIEALPLTREEKDGILGGYAQKLLGIERA